MGPLQQVMSLSKCAQDYALCMANPFTGPIACVPNFPALMTKRQRVYSKGTFVVPAGTNGFVYCDPISSLVNDQPCVNSSAAGYAAGVLALPGTALTVSSNSNSEYTSAMLNATDASRITGRVVSAGLRIRYEDLELNRGGVIYALMTPNHTNMTGFNNATVQAFEESRKFAVHRKWHTVLFKPVDEDDTTMQGPVLFPSLAATLNRWFMGFSVLGDSSVATSYEYEYYAVTEVSGANVRGKIPSHVDPTGFSAVHATGALTNTLAPTDQDTEKASHSFLDTVLDYAENGISWLTHGGAARIAGIGAGIAALF